MNVQIGCRMAVVLALVAASSAQAQSLTARLSSFNFSAVYGGGGDVVNDSGSATWNALDLVDARGLPYLGGHSGYILDNPKRPFSSSVLLDLAQQYAVTGTAAGFSRIEASGHTAMSAMAGGEGAAVINATGPGNELELRFSVASTADARLSGALSHTMAGTSSSSITLQRFDGLVWIYVFWSPTDLPNGVGPFDVRLELPPGDYRIVGEASGNAVVPGGIASNDNAWAYELAICAPADLDCDGAVDASDLAMLLADWGKCSGCAGDVDGDGTVGGADLALLLTHWS